MSVFAPVATAATTLFAARKQQKAQREERREQKVQALQQQAEFEGQQAAITAEQEVIEEALVPVPEEDKRKRLSRLSLIQTSPTGILGTTPVGRRRLLGN